MKYPGKLDRLKVYRLVLLYCLILFALIWIKQVNVFSFILKACLIVVNILKHTIVLLSYRDYILALFQRFLILKSARFVDPP